MGSSDNKDNKTLSLSFEVKRHMNYGICGVKVWDTEMHCYQTGERLVMRGKIGEIGEKIDLRGKVSRGGNTK